MERRKFVVGLGSLAAGGAAAMGTGAFSSASADRTTSTQVRTDTNAYLGITGDTDYTTETNGTLEINFDGNGNGGTGLNANATTEFTDLLTVSNQGTELVLVWVNLNDMNASIGSGGQVTSYLSMEANALANGTDSGMDGGDGTSSGMGTSGAPGQWGVFIPSGQSVDIALQFQNISASEVGQVYNADIGVNAASEDSEMFSSTVTAYTFPNSPTRPYVP